MKEIETIFRRRIKEGYYLFDVVLREYNKSAIKEITIGTILTGVEARNISYKYWFSEKCFSVYGINKEETIRQARNTATMKARELIVFLHD